MIFVALLSVSPFIVPALIGMQDAPPPPAQPTPSVAPAEKPKKVEDLSKLTLDEVIGQLPRVGAEGTLDVLTRADSCKAAMEEIHRRLEAGAVLESRQWQSVLTRSGVVRFRPKWPAGVPLVVAMRDMGLPRRADVSLKVRGLPDCRLHCGAAFELCGTGLDKRMEKELHSDLGVLEPGVHNLVADAELCRPKMPRPLGKPETLWKGPFPLTVEVVPTINDAMPGVATADITKAVRESIGVALVYFAPQQMHKNMIVFDADVRTHPELATIAVAAKVTLQRDGVSMGTAALPAGGNTLHPVAQSVFNQDVQACNAAPLFGLEHASAAPSELARWTLRVEACDDGVLECWRADKRWTGSFEMPLTEALEREKSRIGRVWSRLYPPGAWGD